FPAGLPASVDAAGIWLEGRNPHRDIGPWNALVDEVEEEEAAVLAGAAVKAGVRSRQRGARFRLSGTAEQLFDLAGMLLGSAGAAVGAELRAGLSAFEAALYSRTPTCVMGVLNVTPD